MADNAKRTRAPKHKGQKLGRKPFKTPQEMRDCILGRLQSRAKWRKEVNQIELAFVQAVTGVRVA